MYWDDIRGGGEFDDGDQHWLVVIDAWTRHAEFETMRCAEGVLNLSRKAEVVGGV